MFRNDLGDYWLTKMSAQIFGWLVGVCFLVTLVSGAWEPFIGAAIAALLFVPPVAWFDWRDAHSDGPPQKEVA